METIYLVASGDLRLSANQNCEAAQAAMEKQLVAAVESLGSRVRRYELGYDNTQGMSLLTDVRLLAPVEPSKVIAVGLNYKSHVGDRKPPEYPGIFAKVPTAIIGPYDFGPSYLGQALLVPGAFVAINVVIANFVTPNVLGRRLKLNRVAILLGLFFWSWIWGVPGAFVAVPLLATFKILCDHIDALRPVGEFLGE